MSILRRYFDLDRHDTTVQVESVSGLTTFLAMAYITVVNPSILSQAGMDFGAVFVATCIAAAFGTGLSGTNESGACSRLVYSYDQVCGFVDTTRP